MFNIIISIAAEADTRDAFSYYEDQQKGLGNRFLDELTAYYNKLKLHPTHYSFVSADKTIRAIALKIFPYKIIYQIEGMEVYVYAVYHFRLNPDTLLKRIT